MAVRPRIVFDVNETLLDLTTLEPIFARIFGGQEAMRLWFANLILYSAALTVAGCYPLPGGACLSGGQMEGVAWCTTALSECR